MKLSLCIPVMNQIEDTKAAWGCHVANIINKKDVELLVVDNGSTDGTKEFIEKFIFPFFPDHKYILNPENIGVLASMQQCYKESKGDVIAILHNDLFVYEYGWDQEVIKQFTDEPKLGLAGFLGAEGVGDTGGRYNTVSNMMEAEIHGLRILFPKRVIIFDGLSLICRREMLDEVGGFDQTYTFHHFYDRDISLASYFAGWTNKMIPIYCHHKSGVTANRPEYQAWIDFKMGTSNYTGDNASYLASERRFIDKWGRSLPRWQP